MRSPCKTILFLAILASGPVSQAKPISAFTKKCEALLLSAFTPGNSVKRTWDKLRAERRLVNQNAMDGYDSLCSYACGINITQAVALASGRPPIANPQAAFESYVHSVTDSKSGQRPDQAFRAIQNLILNELGLEVRISGKILSNVYKHDQMIDGLEGVDSLMLRDLMPRAGTIKLMFNHLMEEGSGRGFPHGQILRSFNGKTMTIIEPNAPYLDFAAEFLGNYYLNKQSTLLFDFKEPYGLEGVIGMVPFAYIDIEIP